jgi:hypothetical protein
MTRTRSLFSAALLASVALSFLPLAASAQVPSFQPPPVERATFAAAVPALATPASAGDAVCISGSATKIVRIKRISISGFSGTAETPTIALVLRSAVNTGGTSTSPAAIAMDENNPTATASLKAYTAVPTTAGTAIGTLRAASIGLLAAGAAASPVTWTFDPTQLQQDVVLRGVAQSACVNFPSAPTNAATLNVDVTWTE